MFLLFFPHLTRFILSSSPSFPKNSIPKLQFSSFSHSFHPQFFSNSLNFFLFRRILHKSFNFLPPNFPKSPSPLPLFHSQRHPLSTLNYSSNFTKIPFLTSISLSFSIISPNCACFLQINLVRVCPTTTSIAPKKRTKSNPEAGSSSQAPPYTTRATRTPTAVRIRGNPPDPLGLTNPEHVARFNCLNRRRIVATRYYDDEFLNQMGLLDDIHWLFARGRIGEFIELRDHTYCALTLEFLSMLHVEVIRGPRR